MGFLKYFFLIVISYVTYMYIYTDFESTSPQYWLRGVDLIRFYGYVGEEHFVESEDGFEITIHRIPNKNSSALPVLVVPPMHCCSETFIVSGPQYDIAYRLNDLGFDVWLTNYRGTRYGRPKANSTLTYRQYTDFSFHEQGHFDLPPAIEYILAHTGQKQVQIITGSMGSNVVLPFLAGRPKYNQYVNKVLLMGPTGPFTSLTNDFQKKMVNMLTTFPAFWNLFTLFPIDFEITCYFYFLHPKPVSPLSCWEITEYYLGHNSSDVPNEICALVAKTFMTGPFNGIFDHILQILSTRKYNMRDFGKEENLLLYKNETPPEYNMNAITAPIKLYTTQNDVFLTKEGRELMFKMIPNVKSHMELKPPFAHSNFYINPLVDQSLIDDVERTLNMAILN